MPRSRFHGYDVPFCELQLVAVLVEPFPSILELHLYDVLFFCIPGNVCQPVKGVQLFILLAAAFVT